MGVIEVYLALIIFLYIALGIKTVQSKRKYVIFSLSVLLIIVCLRDFSVGADIPGYLSAFEKMRDYGLKEMLANAFSKKDPVYYISGWLFSKLFYSFRLWITFIAALYFFAVGKLIISESEIPLISIIAFICLGDFAFSLSALRQVIALSFVILSYPFLKSKKYLIFILLVIIASLFHQTAIVFLIAIPFSKMKPGIIHFAIITVSVVTVLFFKTQFLNLLSALIDVSRYQNYLSNNASVLSISGFVIKSVVFIYALTYSRQLCAKKPTDLIFFNLYFLGVVLQLFSVIIAEMFRVSMYFSVFGLILLADASVCEKKFNVRILLQILLVTFLLIYFFKDGIFPYRFFFTETK